MELLSCTRLSLVADGDLVRWGRLGGLETLRRYGRPWFPLLSRWRWKKIAAAQLEEALAAIGAGRP